MTTYTAANRVIYKNDKAPPNRNERRRAILVKLNQTDSAVAKIGRGTGKFKLTTNSSRIKHTIAAVAKFEVAWVCDKIACIQLQ